jgi:hypothetical protein
MNNNLLIIWCVVFLTLENQTTLAQPATSPAATAAAQEAPKIPNDQLDSLVAPIALYADPLLAQTLAASTYPLEIIQLQQWMERNKGLKDKALADAVAKQNWDPSVQAMAAFPEVVQRLAGNIQWTTDLGNAFLAQQSDVMDAVQRMRAKAQGTGNLKTSKEQKVETKTVESKQVIVIEQANPQVIYVPSYDPVVVYGPPAYPYYPYSYPGYVAGRALAFGAGLALGYAWGGGWGWGCGWGHGDVDINVNNKYVNNWNKNTNISRPGQGGSGTKWQHNPEHRGNAPYNRQVANKYANRPGAGGSGTMKPAAGAGNRPGAGGAETRNRAAGAGNRPGAGGSGTMNRPGGARELDKMDQARNARQSTAGNRNLGGSGDRIGQHSASPGAGFGASNAFGGGGFNGKSARTSSMRGAQSFGGGASGGRGGGFRGGGRRR